jgi:hypothetical protein
MNPKAQPPTTLDYGGNRRLFFRTSRRQKPSQMAFCRGFSHRPIPKSIDRQGAELPLGDQKQRPGTCPGLQEFFPS